MNEILDINKASFKILENVAQCIFVVQNLQFLYVNPKGIKFLNCDSSEIYEKDLSNFFAQEDLSYFIDKETEKEEKVTFFLGNCRDEKKWVELTSNTVYWEGEPANLLFLTDVTGQKRSEEKLLLLKQSAEETDRLKSSFLANMSHEIRTPLNAIIGFSQLLSMDEVDEELKKKYYSLIDSNSNQLLELIDDIIDLAKIVSGQVTISKSNFNVNELLDELGLTFSELILQVSQV